jgi:hypothetical protein
VYFITNYIHQEINIKKTKEQQLRMDNLETLATLDTQHRTRQFTEN